MQSSKSKTKPNPASSELRQKEAAKTSRLRALRLAKEAAEAAAAPAKPVKKKSAKKAGEKKSSASLSQWLQERESSGHKN